LHPESNQELYIFLAHIGGFDCVDDESIYDDLVMYQHIPPDEYVAPENPPYSYWCYYVAVNLKALNQLRELRGLNVFTFKPHCGESGNTHHLATGYLLADSINHGNNTIHNCVLTYLYYLSQVGMALCPISNDSLFVKFKDSPVNRFFKIGIRLSLNTDDPLQFHSSDHPIGLH
jgi:AMP deaminase